MRIAHVSDCYLPRLGGIELQVHDLAERQAAAGHDVTVITTTAGPNPGPRPGGSIVVRVGGTGPDTDAICYRYAGRGRDAALDGGFDVVHVHASSFSPLAFLTARETARRGVPTVATVHSLWATATPLFHLADRLAGWGDWPLAWSAVSNAAAIPLRQVLADRADVTILPNGIDAELWQPVPVTRKRDELKLAVVGRLAPRKRPLHLARILYQAHRRLPAGKHISVDIVGDGPERTRLERYLRRHGMTDWVRLSGRLSRGSIRSTLGSSDLFVSPALLESFGIAALEARCAGVPILARSGTGVQDFVTHGRDGWLVDSDEAMVETIVTLANEPDRLDDVRVHNLAIPPSVTWPSVLRSCQALYRSATVRQGLPWASAGPATGTGEAVGRR